MRSVGKSGFLLSLMLAFVWMSGIGCAPQDSEGATAQIGLAHALSKGAVLIDVREPSELAQGGVEGARSIPLRTLVSRLAELNPDDPVIVFCRTGNRSSIAQRVLIENGFKEVINGGSWKSVQDAIASSQQSQ